MTWFPLVFVALCQIQSIIGAVYNNGHQPVLLPTFPATSKICKYDAFMASTEYNGKVFLFPWETRDQRGSWLRNRGYCAKHCAEMVTIHSAEENSFFLDFMRSSVFDGTGLDAANVAIWLGAQVNNKTLSADWTNGESTIYDNKYSTEYNEDGLTCLNAALYVTNDFWYNYYCDWNDYFVACQRPTVWNPNQAPPCYRTNDLVILLDSSGSIGSSSYENAKFFVNELARAYAAQSTSRVAVFIFSDTVSEVVPLDNTFDETTMSTTILDATYLSSITNTDLAINDAVALFNTDNRVANGIPFNVVVITDGASTNPAATLTAIGNALSLDIQTFSVGVGNGVDQNELNEIADNNPNHVFNAANFDDLLNLLNPVSVAICEASTST